MIDKIEKALADIKAQKPLILCLTNFVTIEFVANSLLALGAAPIMSRCEEEFEDLMKIASALYINIGTLDKNSIYLSRKAIKLAKKFNKPIIFDPVGAGASTIRTETAKSILPFTTIIRGNSSEIIALGNKFQTTYGVEAAHMEKTDKAEETAKRLALENDAVVIFSGPVDFITDGNQSTKVPFGSPLMQQITGMGCSLTAIIAAFRSVIGDSFDASNRAAHYFAFCGEVAAKKYKTPGSFKTAFLDQLYTPDFALMRVLYNQRK